MKPCLILTFILGAFALPSFAQDAASLRRTQFNLQDGVALGGYDAVAYFKQDKAVKGRKDLAVFYQGAKYYFSSTENAGAFKSNAAKYEPQYGGWCAYAMGKNGSKVEVDPETYKITDGKLFVFYNKFLTNTLKSWNKDEAALKKSADANWRKFYQNL